MIRLSKVGKPADSSMAKMLLLVWEPRFMEFAPYGKP